MHRATQLLVLIFPLCSLDMHAHCSVMGFRAGETIDGAMAFAEHGVACLHFCSTQETASRGKQWLQSAGNGAAVPFPWVSWLLLLFLPPRKKLQVRALVWWNARAFIAFIYMAMAEAVAECWEQCSSPGWAGLSPRQGPWAAASAPSTFRACAPVLPLEEQTINFDLCLMQCLELGQGKCKSLHFGWVFLPSVINLKNGSYLCVVGAAGACWVFFNR